MAKKIKEQIAEYLQQHPGGVDDDYLAKVLNLSARQQANSRCRQLEKEGLVERRKVRGKIHNFWMGKETKDTQKTNTPIPAKETAQPKTHSKQDNWFWEGNVQAQIIRHLTEQNYLIMSVADTVTFQHILLERRIYHNIDVAFSTIVFHIVPLLST